MAIAISAIACPMAINQKVLVLTASHQLYPQSASGIGYPPLAACTGGVGGRASPSGSKPKSSGRSRTRRDRGNANARHASPTYNAVALHPNRSDICGSTPPIAHASNSGTNTADRINPSAANAIAIVLRRSNQLFNIFIIGSQVHPIDPRPITVNTAYSCQSSFIWLNSTKPTPRTGSPTDTMRRGPSLSTNIPTTGAISGPACVREKAHDICPAVQPKLFLNTGFHTGRPLPRTPTPTANTSAATATMDQP